MGGLQAELVDLVRGAEEEPVLRLPRQRHSIGNSLETVPQDPIRDPKLVHREAGMQTQEITIRESAFMNFCCPNVMQLQFVPSRCGVRCGSGGGPGGGSDETLSAWRGRVDGSRHPSPFP